LRGHDLHTLPQNHYELWVIATRPLANNGLGKSVDQARAELELADRNFPILPEPSTLYSEWKNLVQLHDCKGKIAHDARTVAAMIILGISDLLTFNCSDFARFPMLTVHDPKQLNATA
jgi:predicted nucleic acid-binding protein